MVIIHQTNLKSLVLGISVTNMNGVKMSNLIKHVFLLPFYVENINQALDELIEKLEKHEWSEDEII